MTLIESMNLPNDLILEIWDASRSIAADTTKVEIVVRLPVYIKASYFEEPEKYNAAKETFGSEVLFEYRKERTFVNNSEKDAVFQDLLMSFKKDSLVYLSRPSFPKKFVISRWKDIENKPYIQRHSLPKV